MSCRLSKIVSWNDTYDWRQNGEKYKINKLINDAVKGKICKNEQKQKYCLKIINFFDLNIQTMKKTDDKKKERVAKNEKWNEKLFKKLK